MAYAPAYGRPQPPRQQRPRGPPPVSRGPWPQQGRDQYNHNHNNNSYQQDWQQNDYGGYQDPSSSYQDYAAGNPYYEDHQASPQGGGYGGPSSSWNGYAAAYDQSENNSSYQEYPDDFRNPPPPERDNRLPRQQYPPRDPPPPNRMDPRARGRGPPIQPPPPSNTYASGSRPTMNPGPARAPPPIHAQYQDPRAFQGHMSPAEGDWDRGGDARKHQQQPPPPPPPPQQQQQQQQGRQQQQTPSGQVQQYGRPPLDDDNSYNGYGNQSYPQPSRDQGRLYGDQSFGPTDRRAAQPPNFSRVKDQTFVARPGTATGARTMPPKLDIPVQPHTQPSTPAEQNFDQSYFSPQPHQQQQQRQQSPGQEPASAHGVGWNMDSAFDRPRPSTDSRQGPLPRPTYGTNHVSTSSFEEMPAFGNSSNATENDPLHTSTPTERTGSESRYKAYSPQATQATQAAQLQTQNHGGPSNASAVNRDPYDPSQRTDRGPPGTQPLQRAATADDQYWSRERTTGPRPGPSAQNQSYGDPRGPSLDSKPPLTLNRQPNSFPTELPIGRSKPPGPPRADLDRRDPYSSPGPGPGAGPGRNPVPGGPLGHPAPRSPGPRPHPQGYSSRPGTSSSNRADGSRPETPNQGPNQQPRSAPQETKKDPDALPYHPTPVRPGLVPNGRTSSESQRPAPSTQQHANRPSQESSRTDKPARRKSVPVTQADLSRLREAVSKNPSDNEAQFMLAKKLAEAATVLADDGGRADAQMKSRNQARYNSEAVQIIKKLAASKYPDAMFTLADCYGDGKLGVQPDSKEAFNLYQSAAKLGHAASAYRTAVCCEIGPEEGGGTRKDPEKAVQWYKRAANLGDVPATYKMGIILLKGLLGQQRDLAQAVLCLERAAELADEENPHALHELGLICENPSNTSVRNEAKALDLFTRASRFGYKFSQFKLGQAYEYGLLGCPVDARQSIVWYSKAAAQGEHESELALSGWYLTGSEGIMEHNETEAYLWARKAALADPPVPKALFAMGYFTEVGIGCPRSLEEAKKWYGRSASTQFPKAQQRLDELRRHGSKVQKNRERLSRTNQRQQEENCAVM